MTVAERAAGFPLTGSDPLHTQCAALCWRLRAGKPQVLLITSRETKRWIIPKGWPMEDRDLPQAALQEAWEEAGVQGVVTPVPLGLFTYQKMLKTGQSVTCASLVYPVRVTQLKDKFPEAGKRKRRWVSMRKAANKVGDRELGAILREFRP